MSSPLKISQRFVFADEARLSNLDAGVWVVSSAKAASATYHALPSFLVIGVAKCATHELYVWLSQHAHLRGVSRTDFFSNVRDLSSQWQEYALRPEFSVSEHEDIQTFERAPKYFWAHNNGVPVAALISQIMPSVKLIVLMRDPIKRSYSHFQMKRRQVIEGSLDQAHWLSRSFDEMTQEYLAIGSDSLFSHLFTLSHYAEHLEQWFKYFRKEQLLALTLEEFQYAPFEVMERIQEFIQVPSTDYRQIAEQGHRGWWFIPRQSPKNHSPPYEPMSCQSFKLLTDYYAPWTEKLRRMFPNVVAQWENSRNRQVTP
jgi:hypothetical protein